MLIYVCTNCGTKLTIKNSFGFPNNHPQIIPIYMTMVGLYCGQVSIFHNSIIQLKFVNYLTTKDRL
jgi:uncharacterized YccA/Bax inhibitor family protein